MRRLILVDPDSVLCAAFHTAFRGLPGVEIACGRFEDLDAFDCFVTAGNGFGQMDAGVDAAVVRYFGLVLMEKVQRRILEEYLGEQPVGTAFLVETSDADRPFVCHAPTMRVPMAVDRTDYAYLAMSAALREVARHNRAVAAGAGRASIDIVACPGLCTGYGCMPPLEAARQMSVAYRFAVNPPDRLDWTVAALRHKEIRRGGNSLPVPAP